MSQETLEMIQKLDAKDIQIQLAIQCAPLIAGLKTSNLLKISKANVPQVYEILEGTAIECRVLCSFESKDLFLLFHKGALNYYLTSQVQIEMLNELGYEGLSFDEMLDKFAENYTEYMNGEKDFPHEIGLFLGYPVEDVRGFIENEGQKALGTGYWKVYASVEQKQELFREFERARDILITEISQGAKVRDFMMKLK